MSVFESEVTVVRLLVDNEVTTGQLYQLYAEYFPAYRTFWSNLAKEESEHAAWVLDLQNKLTTGELTVIEHRFFPEVYREFQTYLEQQIAEALKHPPTLLQALTTAVYIENTFIEKNFYTVFESDSDGVSYILNRLATSTTEHLQSVKKMLEKCRLQQGT